MSEQKSFTEKLKGEQPKNEPEDQGKQSDISKLSEENASLKESLLRALAESENTAKRLKQDRDLAVQYAISGVVKDLALIMDHFYLSLDSISQKDKENNPELKNFHDAISITMNEVVKFMEKNGVRRINPIGEKFNPKEHEAVSQQQTAEAEPGTVLQVLSAGYALSDRILKPAMVVVSF